MATDDPQACKAVAEYWETVGSGRFERILRLATTVEGWEDIDSDSDDGDEEEAATSMRVQGARRPLRFDGGDKEELDEDNAEYVYRFRCRLCHGLRKTIRAVWELNTWPAWNPLVSSVDSMYFLDDTDRSQLAVLRWDPPFPYSPRDFVVLRSRRDLPAHVCVHPSASPGGQVIITSSEQVRELHFGTAGHASSVRAEIGLLAIVVEPAAREARFTRCEVTVFAHVRPNGDDGWLPDWLIDKVHFDQVTCLIALDKYLAELDDDFECATPKP